MNVSIVLVQYEWAMAGMAGGVVASPSPTMHHSHGTTGRGGGGGGGGGIAPCHATISGLVR